MLTLSAKWKRLTEVRERLRQIDSEQAALESAADRYNGGAFSDEQRSRYDALTAEWRERKDEQGRLEDELKHTKPPHLPRRTRPEHAGAPGGMTQMTTLTADRGETWQDAQGNPVRVLAPTESLAAAYRPEDGEERPRLGRAVRALVTGSWRNAAAEMAAMGTATAGTHMLVPEVLSADVIDRARAASVLVRAGARMVEMTTDRLVMVRVKNDPTFETKAENVGFTESEVVFDSIGFTARTIGTVITMSRELFEDAPNAPEIFEDTLGRALAVELDRLGLEGTGSAEPTGLRNLPGIGVTGSVGPISWEDYLDAIEQVETANHTPNAYILNPAVKADLARLTSGDGATSAKVWLPAPPDVAALTRLVSNNCSSENSYVGDFTKFLIGLRSAARLEVSTEAGDTFKKHQVQIKITWRGDFNVSHLSAFHVLSGITS